MKSTVAVTGLPGGTHASDSCNSSAHCEGRQAGSRARTQAVTNLDPQLAKCSKADSEAATRVHCPIRGGSRRHFSLVARPVQRNLF